MKKETNNEQKTIIKSPNVSKKKISSSCPYPSGSDRAKEWERDHTMVTGRFKFHEVPRGDLKFCYKKHKGDSMKPYVMKDGEVYTVPRMVAKHLNSGGRRPVHRYCVDEEGNTHVRVGEWIDRFSFIPIGVFDDEDIQPKPDLVTVENV